MAKVTVYVDDQVWSRFRAAVFQRHGSLKVLSKEVDESLKSALVGEDVLPFWQSYARHPTPRLGPGRNSEDPRAWSRSEG